MRLHHLEVTAFGPFASTVDLDLERISDSGLFLIHGPTGSGKTSILDAICFALYANVPSDRHATTLRSQHAAEADPTSVTLELTLSGRRLRITRHPAYDRPKKRGTGTTTQPAKVQLEELARGSWMSLSSRNDETAQILEDLLGMGLDQFRRVVMLPQGDFAAFLSASDEKRREVLEKLFDVTDYVGVENWLVDQRKHSQKVLTESRSALSGHLTRLAELLFETDADLPETESPWGDLPLDELTPLIDAVDTALTAHNDEIMTIVDRSNQVDTAARRALEAGRLLDELRRRGLRARTSLEQLSEEEATHSDRRRQLARGRDAATVLPLVDAAARTTKKMRATHEAHTRARTALTDELLEVDLADWLAQVHDHDEGMATARHELDHVARRVREVPLLDADIVQRATALQGAVDDVDTTAARAVATRAAAREVEDARLRLAEVVPERTRLSDLVAARTTAVGLEDELRLATDASQARRQNALDLRTRTQDLVQARLDNMAGELAAQLIEGQACGVCGSTAHPAPAGAAQLVTSEEIEEATETADAAARAHEDARTERESVASRLELARARVASLDTDTMAPEDLTEALAELDQERVALGEVVGRQAALNHALTTVEQSVVDVEHARGQAATHLAEARVRRDQVEKDIRDSARRGRNALDAHAGACPCDRLPPANDEELESETTDDEDSSEDELTSGAAAAWLDALERSEGRHATARTLAGDVLSARDELSLAQRADNDASRLLDDALAESNFVTSEEVVAAAIDRKALADLEQHVAEHERQLANARAVLAEDEVQSALGAPAPDLAALSVTAKRAHVAADAASRRQASAQTVLRQFVTIRDHIRDTCARIGPAAEHAAVAQRMGDLVTGTSRDNDKRMRLSTYVLAARLERIVELANERLAVMADGRYELSHDDASARGQQRGGLGLIVRDLWTGLQRPTGTLSGGESFTTSLALALGLADAIREESGGQEFGTLFVDEGFGSLDIESLEQVLDVLDRLRDGGRAVGVVSHVQEMRTRIPTQIRVDKTQRGSSVTVLQAADDVA